MSVQERKQYNLVIFVLFIVLFFIYGGLGVWAAMDGFGPFSQYPLLSGIGAGLMAGWGFTSLVGGIWLGCRYVSKQSKGFIILACVLFMGTIMIFWWVGLFVAIPFAIYNAVILRRAPVPGEKKRTPTLKPTNFSIYPPPRNLAEEYAQIISLLDDRLDPDLYIQELNRFIATGKYQKAYPKYPRIPEMDLLSGTFAKGEIEQAIEGLLKIDEDETIEASTRIGIQANLCVMYAAKEDISRAKTHYENFNAYRRIYAGGGFVFGKKRRLAHYEGLLPYLDAKICLLERDFQKALELSKKLWEKEDITQRAKITIQFDLATIYEKLGKEAERKACLEYVATHGNQHYKAHLAREMLGEADLE